MQKGPLPQREIHTDVFFRQCLPLREPAQQIFQGVPAADQPGMTFQVDEYLGGTQPVVVIAGHGLAVGAGVHDPQDIALADGRELPIVG